MDQIRLGRLAITWHCVVIFLLFGLGGCASLSSPAPVSMPPGIPEEPKTSVQVTVDTKPIEVPAPTQVIEGPKPTTSDKENVIVRTFFATNRQATGSSAPYMAFNSIESTMTYGVADVSIPREHRLGRLEAPFAGKRFLESEKKHVMLMGLAAMSHENLMLLIRERVSRSPGKSVLVFIHGYTVSFEDAARRAAQMSYDLGFDGAPVFYSWPSEERLFGYEEDGEVIARAVPKIESFLKDIFERSEADNIFLVAHSMGNRGMAKAVANLASDYEFLRPKLRQLILTSPDIAAEDFEKEIAPALIKAGLPVTLYASSKDKALWASKNVANKDHRRRLGDTLGGITVIKGIETIDASDVSTDFLGHSYFAENGSVISDMFYLFKTDLRPQYRFNMSEVSYEKGTYWKFKPGMCKP